MDAVLVNGDLAIGGPCSEESHALEQFQILQTVLNQLRLPPTVDRRGQPRAVTGKEVTVVLLAEVEEVLSVFLEGSRQCPGGFLFVLTPSWLCREASPEDRAVDTLYVRQALTADTGSQTYLDRFSPPRRATYQDNQLYGTVTSGRSRGGEKVGVFGLDIPTCSSMALDHRADDKLLTTIMCAAAGVAHPVTLGMWLPGESSARYSSHYPTITLFKLMSRHVEKEELQAAVRNFLGSSAMHRYQQVVVKPFGPIWNSCKGVTYHAVSDVNSILRAIRDLLVRIDPGTGILLQSYHATFEPVVTPGLGRHALDFENIQLGFRLRAIVVRTAQNGVRMSQLICGINDSNFPIGGVHTMPCCLNPTLQQWGVTDPRQQRRIYDSVRESSERLMAELLRQEALLTAEERGGHYSQTELLGIDLILTREKDCIVPVVIEVNARDCLYHVTILESMQPEVKGQAVGPVVRTMLHRSLGFLLAGRTVLVVGAGGYSKRQLWKDAADYGVKIILVDSHSNHLARTAVDTFLQVDIDDHTQDVQNAATILALLEKRLPGRVIDGCLTFWEDCGPLAALVAEGLNLQHCVSYQAALNAKSKVRTQEVLRNTVEEPPHHLPVPVFASPSVRVESVEQVEEAMKKIPSPAVLKLEFGSSAIGVKHVKTVEEAKEHVHLVHSTLRSEQDHPGIGLGYGQSLILTSRLLGSEHDVDVVLFEDQLVTAFVSDNGPTPLPLCNETSAAMPSVLSQDHQRQLIWAAAACCRGLGLHTGVFNVEMMLTPRGPRLIEINARMGGFYLRDWIRLVYGVDLLQLSLACACGIRPYLTGSSSLDQEDVDKKQLMGIMLYSSRHQHALASKASPQRLQSLHDQGHVVFTQFEPEVNEDAGSFEEPYGNLAVLGQSVDDARTRLAVVCTRLGLENEESLQEMLQDFVSLS